MPRDPLAEFDKHATSYGMTESEIADTESALGRKLGDGSSPAEVSDGEPPKEQVQEPAGQPRDGKGRFAQRGAQSEPEAEPEPGPAAEPAAEPEPEGDTRFAALEARVTEQAEQLRSAHERNDRIMEMALTAAQRPPVAPTPPEPVPELDPDIKENLDPYLTYREKKIREEVLGEVKNTLGDLAPALQQAQKLELQGILKNTFKDRYNDEFYERFEETVKAMPEKERARYDHPEGVELLGRRILDEQPASGEAPPPVPRASSRSASRAHSETSTGEQPRERKKVLTPADIMNMTPEEHAAYTAAKDREYYGPNDGPDPLLR